MAEVKCRYCGNALFPNGAYSCANGKKKMYFCSEEEYYKWNEQKEKKKIEKESKPKPPRIRTAKDDTYDVACRIFNKKIDNAVYFMEAIKLGEIDKYELITQFLCDNEDRLSKIVARLDGTEDQKIKYVSSIVLKGIKTYNTANTETENEPQTSTVVFQEYPEDKDVEFLFTIRNKKKFKRRRGFSEEECE